MNKFYKILFFTFYIMISIIIIKIIYHHTLTKNKCIMSDEKRIIFYLGEELYNKDNININEYQNVGDIYNFEEYKKNNIIPGNSINALESLFERTDNKEKRFSYQPGDIWSGNGKKERPSIITLVKNRDRLENKGVILRSFNFNRHWGKYYEKPNDIDFQNKNDIVIWRGVTTGQLSNPGNRFDLIKRWYNVDPEIDIGFNRIVQGKDEYNKYMKGKMTPEQMLKNKYIISVEGNDKDSGLNWKLNSNSVILMPRPLSSSWLMERELIPNYHYVILRDDFSDLKEKLEWCKNNQKKCKRIIKNANKFMSQFGDIEKELLIEEEVIKSYFKKVKFD